MLVYSFDATSSPSVCGYSLRKIFSREAVDTAVRGFYVDNFLKSFVINPNTVSKEIQRMLSQGRLKLTKWKKWIANDREVLAAFRPEKGATILLKTLIWAKIAFL